MGNIEQKRPLGVFGPDDKALAVAEVRDLDGAREEVFGRSRRGRPFRRRDRSPDMSGGSGRSHGERAPRRRARGPGKSRGSRSLRGRRSRRGGRGRGPGRGRSGGAPRRRARGPGKSRGSRSLQGRRPCRGRGRGPRPGKAGQGDKRKGGKKKRQKEAVEKRMFRLSCKRSHVPSRFGCSPFRSGPVLLLRGHRAVVFALMPSGSRRGNTEGQSAQAADPVGSPNPTRRGPSCPDTILLPGISGRDRSRPPARPDVSPEGALA